MLVASYFCQFCMYQAENLHACLGAHGDGSYIKNPLGSGKKIPLGSADITKEPMLLFVVQSI